MKPSRAIILCAVILLVLFALYGAAQHKRDAHDLSVAWEDGYWYGATNGLQAAQIGFVKAQQRHGPINPDDMWPTFSCGLTNNPYSAK